MYTCGRFILIFGLNFFFQKYTIHLKKPWPQSQCEARYRDFLCESNSADFLSYQSGSFVKGKVFNFITAAAAAAAKLLQSCPTLFDPRDGIPPGSPIPGILQTRFNRKNTGVGCHLFVLYICEPDSVLLYLFVGLILDSPYKWYCSEFVFLYLT